MQRHSPTRDGFRSLFQSPIALIEISWRWSLGAIFILLTLLCLAKYLRSLPVSESQMLLLGSGQSALMLRTFQELFKGSGPRFLAALTVLFFSTTLAWILFASFGRASTLNALLRQVGKDNSVPIAPILRLNALRALVLITVILISAAAFIMTGGSQGSSSSSVALLLAALLVGSVWSAWIVVNWLLSVAPIFVAENECNAFAAIGLAIDLCRSRFGSLFVIGLWFGALRSFAFSSMGLFALVLVALTPTNPATLPATVIATSLGYFFLADFLYAGRLAAYFSLANAPLAVMQLAANSQSIDGYPPQIGSVVDPDELILSDLPGLA